MDSLIDNHDLISLRTEFAKTKEQVIRLQNMLSETETQYSVERSKLNQQIDVITQRYERLSDSHQRLSKLNHDLEERLLDMVDKFKSESDELRTELESTKLCLKSVEESLIHVTNERDRYKEDCLSAVNLLQSNPKSFISSQTVSKESNINNTITYLSVGDCSQGARNSTDLHDSSSPFQFTTYVPTFPPMGFLHSSQLDPYSQQFINPNTINEKNRNAIVDL